MSSENKLTEEEIKELNEEPKIDSLVVEFQQNVDKIPLETRKKLAKDIYEKLTGEKYDR